jgi:hypothetical protein
MHHRDGGPEIARYLGQILACYPDVKLLECPSYGNLELGPFYGMRQGYRQRLYYRYPFVNKVYAMGEVWLAGLMGDYDFLVTLDTDMYIRGPFAWLALPASILSGHCSGIANHWIATLHHFGGPDGVNHGKGIDLLALLRALYVSDDAIVKYRNGSVINFIRRQDFTEQFLQAALSYLRILLEAFILGGSDHQILQEMACYSLAFAHCDINVEVIKAAEFSVDGIVTEAPPLDAILHYGFASPFPRSPFNKRSYYQQNIFVEDLTNRAGRAATAHERDFWSYLAQIRDLYNIQRS